MKSYGTNSLKPVMSTPPSMYYSCKCIIFKEPDTNAITRAKKEYPKVIINVGGMKHEVIHCSDWENVFQYGFETDQYPMD